MAAELPISGLVPPMPSKRACGNGAVMTPCSPKNPTGAVALGSEPDNSTDAKSHPWSGLPAIGLNNWPKGFADDQGYGNAGEWNDLAESNKLGFIVEFS